MSEDEKKKRREKIERDKALKSKIVDSKKLIKK
jgi:hypothetical protein